jgi:hypothetical protein
MKQFQNYLPSGLLFAYCIYTAFVPLSIAHSLIILSLAALCGYQSYISRQETTKYNNEALTGLKNEFETKLEEQKEFYAKKIAKLEDEVAKMALNTLPPKAPSSSPIPRKVVF